MVQKASSQRALHEVTPADRIALLGGEVQALVAGGAAIHGGGQLLYAKLGVVLASLGAGRGRAPAGRLGAFENQVTAVIRVHRLSRSQAQALLSAADAATAQINGG